MSRKINVTIYNEYYHEKTEEAVRQIYPAGIHEVIAGLLREDGQVGAIRTATLDNHEQALTQEALDDTDVMVWWGHLKHGDVSDEVVDRVARRVYEGMGLIVLHSGHASKIFQKLLGAETQRLRWREAGERARVWVVAPNHPIAEGLGESFVVPHDETYGELFGIPTPDELIFITWFQGGEVFRSGCTFSRGSGKIFYLQNGHETFPVYYQPEIQQVIKNAVHWAAPVKRKCVFDLGGPNAPALEKY